MLSCFEFPGNFIFFLLSLFLQCLCCPCLTPMQHLHITLTRWSKSSFEPCDKVWDRRCLFFVNSLLLSYTVFFPHWLFYLVTSSHLCIVYSAQRWGWRRQKMSSNIKNEITEAKEHPSVWKRDKGNFWATVVHVYCNFRLLSPPFLTKDSFWGFEGTLLNRLLLYIHIAIIRKSTYDFLYRSTADLQYCVSFSLQQSDSDIYICFPWFFSIIDYYKKSLLFLILVIRV